MGMTMKTIPYSKNLLSKEGLSFSRMKPVRQNNLTIRNKSSQTKSNAIVDSPSGCVVQNQSLHEKDEPLVLVRTSSLYLDGNGIHTKHKGKPLRQNQNQRHPAKPWD